MSDNDEEQQLASVVLDLGSDFVRGGFSGDDAPRAVYPSVISKPKRQSEVPIMAGDPRSRPQYLSSGVVGGFSGTGGYRNLLKDCYPIKNSHFEDWDDFKAIFHHTLYDELRVDPEEHNIFFCEPPFTTPEYNAKMCEILFEEFSVKSFSTFPSPSLGLFSSGRTTGLVVDCGKSRTISVPVHECNANLLPQAINRMDLGGETISEYFTKLVISEGRSYFQGYSSYERLLLEDMKQKRCYLIDADDIDLVEEAKRLEESKTSLREEDFQFELPDGSMLELGPCMFQAPEILFNPQPFAAGGGVERQQDGIHKMIAKSLAMIPPAMREEFVKNIVLTGGVASTKNLPTRLLREMKRVVPPELAPKVRIVCPPEAKYSNWIGGSIVTSLTSFEKQDMWIPREQYDEYGAEGVVKKLINSQNGYGMKY